MSELNTEMRVLEGWAKDYEWDSEYVTGGMAVDVTNQTMDILLERGLNQPWLAKKLGVSRQSINRIFNADNPNFKLITVAKIAIALGVKPKILLDSERYLIAPIDQQLDMDEFEALKTAQAIQRDRVSARYSSSGDSTTIQAITSVGSQYATAE